MELFGPFSIGQFRLVVSADATTFPEGLSADNVMGIIYFDPPQ